MTTTTPTSYAGGLTRQQVINWRNSIFLVFLLPGMAMATWVSRLPAVRDTLDIRIDQVGVLILAMALGSVIGLVFSSHIIARLGARTTILAGLIVLSVGLAIIGMGVSFGPVFGIAFGGLFVLGFSSGIIDVAMNVSGAANERTLRKAIMPIFHAFFSLGTMIGAGLGALAELARVPIALHFGILSVVIVVVSLIVVRNLQSEHLIEEGADLVADDDHSNTWRGRLAIWKDSRTILVGLIVLAAAFAEGSANDWLALAMVDGHGVENATGALVFGIFVTAMTVGRLGGVVLLNRFGRVPVLRASFLLASAGLLVIIFVPNPIVATIGAIAWGLGSALGFPIGMSAAADDPRTAAARVSAVATIGYFAFLVGPPVIGFLGEQVGLLGALLIVVVLCAMGVFVSSAAKPPTRPASTPPATDTLVDPADAATR